MTGKLEGASGPPGLGPEAELLLTALRTCSEEERGARVRALLEEAIDWEHLLRLAMHNRILAFLYRCLRAVPSRKVPPDFMEKVHGSFRMNALRNMFLARELLEILHLFEDKGIAALPYKGPLLASSLYGDLALRQFWDLDLLIHASDVPGARELLAARGYEPERRLDAAGERALLKTDCEYNFTSRDGRVHLELHWRILPRPFSPCLDMKRIWDRARRVDLMGRSVRTLPPEDLFLVLCIHGGDKHQWARLKWVGDVARFIEVRRDADWDRILAEAVRLGRERTVALGLHLAQTLLGAVLPPTMGGTVSRDPRLAARAGLVRARLFREDFGLPGFSEWLSYVRAGKGISREEGSPFRRFRDFARYFGAVMRPEFRDRYTLGLPPWLSFLSYFYRILRIAREHKGDLISRLR